MSQIKTPHGTIFILDNGRISHYRLDCDGHPEGSTWNEKLLAMQHPDGTTWCAHSPTMLRPCNMLTADDIEAKWKMQDIRNWFTW